MRKNFRLSINLIALSTFFPPFNPNEITAPAPFGINLAASLFPL